VCIPGLVNNRTAGPLHLVGPIEVNEIGAR
jgi:hypothetical protein